MIFTHHVRIVNALLLRQFKNSVKFFYFLPIFLIPEAFADVRDDALYKTPRVRQFLAFGGYYQSNSTEKDHEASFVYGYKSDKHIFEIEAANEIWYRQNASKGVYKDRELYDVEASAKTILGKTKNYLLFYHRTKYDDLSDYYYDTSSAAGLGRRFFNEKLDLDVSLGYGDIKFSGYRYTLNIGSRADFDITEKLQFRQKVAIYSDLSAVNHTIAGKQLITDNYDVESSLIYRIDKNLLLEFYHTYEKDTYRKTTSKKLRTYKESDRKYTMRLKVEF